MRTVPLHTPLLVTPLVTSHNHICHPSQWRWNSFCWGGGLTSINSSTCNISLGNKTTYLLWKPMVEFILKTQLCTRPVFQELQELLKYYTLCWDLVYIVLSNSWGEDLHCLSCWIHDMQHHFHNVDNIPDLVFVLLWKDLICRLFLIVVLQSHLFPTLTITEK